MDINREEEIGCDERGYIGPVWTSDDRADGRTCFTALYLDNRHIAIIMKLSSNNQVKYYIKVYN